MASTSSQLSSGEAIWGETFHWENPRFSLSYFQGFEKLSTAPMIVFSISDDFEFIRWRRKIKVESVHINIDVSVRVLHYWHGKEALFLRARSWRFSSNVLCCQTESLLGCKKKKQSGLRCHDPCMLETAPVGRCALFSHVCRTFSPPHQHC